MQLGGTLAHATSIAQAGYNLSMVGGFVGIGTNAPIGNLHLDAGATGSRALTISGTQPSIRLVDTTSGTVTTRPDWIIDQYADQFRISREPSIAAGGGLTVLAIANNGNVGIGTTTPTNARLVVNGSGLTGVQGAFSHVTYGTNYISTGTIPTTTPTNCGIFASSEIISLTHIRSGGAIQSIASITASDSRIKDVVGVSNSKEDLLTLEKIKVTDYTMKDKTLLGTRVIKKVIAQDVERVYPRAVSIVKNYLPDIMETSKLVSKSNNTFEVNIEKSIELKVGDRIRVMDGAQESQFPIIQGIENGKMLISLSGQKDGNEVFLYGREVDDFRTVDYDALSMLNISATQELAKKVTALEAENAELKKLAAEMKQIKALVTALEDKANGTATVSLTK